MQEIVLDEGTQSISGAIQQILAIFPDEELWFRGQVVSEGWGLMPSIFRGNRNEAAMVEEFQYNYPGERSRQTNTLEWLALMQHYGVPTRLIDWSTSLFVGLHFAARSYAATEEERNEQNALDGALFVLRTKAFDNEHYRRDAAAAEFQEVIDNSIYESNRNFLLGDILGAQVRILKREIPYYCTTQAHLDGASFEVRLGDQHNVYLHARRSPLDGIIAGHAERLRSFWVETTPGGVEGFSQLVKLEVNATRPESNGNIFSSRHWADRTADLQQAMRPRKAKLPRMSKRIQAQHGVFSLHPGKYFDGEPLLDFRDPAEEWGDDLLKITIPQTAKLNILRELRLGGIAEHTLFPEMDRVAGWITQRFSS